MSLLGWIVRLLKSPTPTPIPPPPLPSPAPTPTPTPNLSPDGLVAALNVERTKRGLGALREDPKLSEMAGSWARAMAKVDVLSHGDFAGRITGVYPNTAGAEDIAEGAATVAGVVTLWMNSPPHRENILGPYSAAGAGNSADATGTIYWCVDFDAPGT